MNNKNDDELYTYYNQLLYKQSFFKEDIDICVIINGIEKTKTSEFFKAFEKLNEEIDQIREILIERGLIKNRLIFPSFETK